MCRWLAGKVSLVWQLPGEAVGLWAECSVKERLVFSVLEEERVKLLGDSAWGLDVGLLAWLGPVGRLGDPGANRFFNPP